MKQITILKIAELDRNEISDLVQVGLDEGYPFMARLKNEFDSGENRFDKYGEALFVAKFGDEIVGVCGLNVDPYLKNHNFGRVRHLYVSTEFQNQGIAKSLVQNVIDEASRHFEVLVLRTNNPIADRLYRGLGFSNESPYDSTTHYLRLSNNK